jgi:hypothetical protein
MVDEKQVADMADGETGYTVPWAFNDGGRFRFNFVWTSPGGTACVEVEMRAGEIMATSAGILAMEAFKAKQRLKPVSDLSEGEVGYVTHWSVDEDGSFGGEHVRTEPAGTSNVEVMRQGDAVILTPAGRRTIASETAGPGRACPGA